MQTANFPQDMLLETSATTLNVLIIYEDFSSGVRAKNFAESLASKCGRRCPLDKALWRCELLEFPSIAAETARAVADCDYLIISLRGDRPLTIALRHWLEGALDGAAARGTGVIALVNFNGTLGRADGGARHHLRFLCADKGVEFFSHAGTLLDEAAAQHTLSTP